MATNAIATVRERGFTLVELVMTLVIVAILAVFAVSRLDFKSTFDERAYHDRLKAGLQFARKAAVASRRYVCVAAAANVVTFTIEAVAPESTSGACPFPNPLSLPSPDTGCGGATNTICVPSGVTLTPSAASFQFDAKGGSSAAVTFSSTGPFAITVEPETGYVH